MIPGITASASFATSNKNEASQANTFGGSHNTTDGLQIPAYVYLMGGLLLLGGLLVGAFYLFKHKKG